MPKTLNEYLHELRNIADDDSDGYNSEFDNSDFDSDVEEEDITDSGEPTSDQEDEEEPVDSVSDAIDQVITNARNLSSSGVQWYEIKCGERRNKKFESQNVFTENFGVTSYAKTRVNETALSAFLCIIDKPMLKIIIECTNKYAISQKSNFQITLHDLLSFIGVLYSRGVFSGKTPFKALWSEKYGIPLVKALMSRDKCLRIMRYLRFDDKSTRSSRVVTDKFAPIRDVWERYIENSKSCYKPYLEMTYFVL
jgi:hypothetical protein